MKKTIKTLVIAGLFLIAPMVLLAQNPPHLNGGSGPGSGNTPVGGGAPVGEGIILLLTMAATYGSKKVYNLNKKKE